MSKDFRDFEYITESDDETQESDFSEISIDFEQPFIAIFVGKCGHGKTNAIRWLLYKHSVDLKHFKMGIVFSRTAFVDSDYDFIPKEYKFTQYDSNILQTFMSHLEELKNKDDEIPPSFVLFDDMLGLLAKNDPVLTNFHAVHRHYQCSVLHAVQYLNTSINTTIKSIVNYAFIFKTHDFQSLDALWRSFGMHFKKFNDFRNFLFKHTEEKYTALVYDNDSEKYYEIPNDKADNVRTKFKLSNLVSIIKYRYEEILEKVATKQGFHHNYYILYG